MTQFIALVARVGELLGSVAEQGIGHLIEVETDLAQTALLLTEAIEKLGASFMAIHASVSAQQQSVDRLLAGAVPNAEELVELNNIHRAIGQHVNAAVTGLQFQDMTNQLIERSRSHVAGVREALALLSQTAASITPHTDLPALEALLDQASAAIGERRMLLHDTLRKSVNQTHMESGDVELF